MKSEESVRCRIGAGDWNDERFTRPACFVNSSGEGASILLT